jgi:hypothetical protein
MSRGSRGLPSHRIVAILNEGEAGVALSALTRKHGISRATYFNWQAKYGGVSVSELNRMKGLEAEIATVPLAVRPLDWAQRHKRRQHRRRQQRRRQRVLLRART